MEIDIVTCAHCGAKIKPSSIKPGEDNYCSACGNYFSPESIAKLLGLAEKGRTINPDIGYPKANPQADDDDDDEKEDVPRRTPLGKTPRGPVTRIALDGRGYSTSFSGLISMLSGEATTKQEGNWIEVEEREPGTFAVVNDNMTVKGGNSLNDSTDLGFSQWDSEVEDLDHGDSDESECLGISSHLKWNDVEMFTSGNDATCMFKAPSIDRLNESLKHVRITTWCPGDI